MFEALIKVGGSLCNSPGLKELTSRWADLARRYRLLFVTGGGFFADQVRMLDDIFNLSDSAAHWMAIAAMDQCGFLLADCMPGVELVHDLDETLSNRAPCPSAVLIPSSHLRRHDPLPHSWAVTSDALVAWLAGSTGIECLVLLKDVPGVYQTDSPITPPPLLTEITREQLANYEVVDPTFSKVLPDQVECWIIDGRHPNRLEQLLETGKTAGTRIAQDRTPSG